MGVGASSEEETLVESDTQHRNGVYGFKTDAPPLDCNVTKGAADGSRLCLQGTKKIYIIYI